MTLLHEAVGHQNYLSCLAFSPNGELLLSGSRDGTAKLWNVATGELLRTIWWGSQQICAVAWSPDGLTIGIAGYPPPRKLSQERFDLILAARRGDISYQDLTNEPHDGRRAQLRLYRVSNGELLHIFDDAGSGVAFAPNGQSLTAVHWDRLSIIDLQSGTRRTSEEYLHLCEPCYSLDGTLVACVGECGIHVFDAVTAKLVRIAHDPHLFETTNPPSEGVLISALQNLPSELSTEELLGHILRFWQELLSDFYPYSFFDNHREHRIAFSPDRKWAVLKPSFQQKFLWTEHPRRDYPQLALIETDSGCIRSFLRNPNLALTTVAFSLDGSLLAWGGSEETIDLRNVSGTADCQSLGDPPPAITGLCLSQSSRFASAGTCDGRLIVFDWQQMDVLAVLPLFDHAIKHVEYSPDGKWLVVATREGAVCLLEAVELKAIRTFSAHDARFLGGSFTADGRHFISLGYAEVWPSRQVGKPVELIRWSLPDGSRLASLELPEGFRANTAAASPDRKKLAISSRDELLVAEIGDELSYRSVLRQDESGAVAFLPDSTRLLVADEAYRMQLVDLDTGTISKSFSGVADGPSFHAFNSTTSILVRATYYDEGIELFDVTTQKYLRRFIGHQNSVNVVAFTPDDASVLSAGRDGTLKLWDAESGKLLASIVVFAEPDADGRRWECLKAQCEKKPPDS